MTIYQVLDSNEQPGATLDVDDATGAAVFVVVGATPLPFPTAAAAIERIEMMGGSVPTYPSNGG